MSLKRLVSENSRLIFAYSLPCLVKTPSRKTNNHWHASFGGSLLKNNMEVEAAMELQRYLDETSVHQVRTIYV
jgi:hypothetical protein